MDRKRALVSRLLQRAAAARVLGLPWDAVHLGRTREGKPHLAGPSAEAAAAAGPHLPCFNFNVSHHGDWVALASEPLCLVGVDVMVHEPRPHRVSEAPEDFFKAFRWGRNESLL